MIAHTSLLALVLLLPAAAHDDSVEWNGVTHIDWLDRTPRCPIDGESFEISFQTYQYDITSAQVHVDDGTGWVDASWSHPKGPYDVWTADIPATAQTSLSYYIKLTDGIDTDYLNATGMSETDPGGGGWSLDYSTVSHAPVGATVTSEGVAFKVWAADASSATLRGEFNSWGETAMNTDGNYWWVHYPGADNLDNYKFYFVDRIPDYDPWQRDARFRTYDPNVNNNSIVFDSTIYQWGDAAYTPPPFEEMVIYELHVGTFSGKNDGLGDRMGRFRDVVDTHLDHLLYLGVNMVELMPVPEFDGYNSWGYNPTNQWGVEESYAESPQTGPDDLKYLVDKLHQAGIGVILDVVYNHFSIGGNFMWCYDGHQIYFDGDCYSGYVDTPWGAQADFDRDEVADYFAQNIIYWMDEHHVDGFRMDGTRYMRDNYIFPLGQPSGWDLMRRINDSVDNRAVHKISIAEELPNETTITTPTGSGGAGFDSQWHDEFGDAMRVEIAKAGSGDPDMNRIKNAINAFSYPNKTNLVRYVESHDEPGNDVRLPVKYDGGDPTGIWARGRSKMAQGLTMLVPGIPMFFQGGEWIEEQEFDSQMDYRLDWNKAVSHAPLTLYFHDLIGVRRSNCALRSDAGVNVHHTNDTDNIIAFHRWDLSGNQIIVVASAADTDLSERIGFPAAGTWYEILNSDAVCYDGSGSGNGGSITTEAIACDGMTDSAEITVPRMGLLVFRYEDPLGRDADLNSDGHVDLFDYYILQQRAGDAGCGMNADLDEDGRVDKADVAVMVNNLTGPN